MPDKANIYVFQASHLDLFWMGSQETCLGAGARIIGNAVDLAADNRNFYYFIESVRFLEYYLDKHPEKKETLRKLVLEGQIEIAGDYTDRMENQHDGESLLRNLLYGKKVLKDLLGVDTRITYHPDIPGFSEQIPQICKKAGVPYYLSARGFKNGARFLWRGLDKSRITMYSFPVHYSYYSVRDEVMPYMDEIRKSIKADEVMLSMSGGDLGPANTFSPIEDGKWRRVVLTDYIKVLNSAYPAYSFRQANIVQYLDRQGESGLEESRGENPSRWGLTSALETRMFQMDKRVSAKLLEAEKYSTVCDLLGMSVEIDFPAHPLRHRGSSGGSRKYFDLKFKPSSTTEYIDFGWRLQAVTQDHNYSGVDGAQTDFDRNRYKEAAVRIAETITKNSLDKICSCIDAGNGSIVVFNGMNWDRTEIVHFESIELDKSKNYIVRDSRNNCSPLIKCSGGYCFLAMSVPSFGYKRFTMEEGNVEASSYREITQDKEQIKIRNRYYDIAIDRNKGSIKYVNDLDLGVNLVSGDEFLTIDAFRDTSVCVNENITDKPLLDESRKNVWDAAVTEDNYLWTKVEVKTEVCNANVKIVIMLNHLKKELKFSPVIYWHGVPDVLLRMNINFNKAFKSITYSVPYGAQKLGEYLENPEIFKDDEIIPELYKRYREVQQWFVMESENAGICINSNHSAFDFNQSDVNINLLRDVRNCGEFDSRHSNVGELNYEFSLTSYKGNWEENTPFVTSWEMINPLLAYVKSPGTAAGSIKLPAEKSFIDTDGKGILTVFKKSENENGKYVARIFNSTSAELPLRIENGLNLGDMDVCDFSENIIDDALDRLEPFEIKAIKLGKKPS